MDHKKVASQVLANVGGEDNIKSLMHCITRLRFVLKDSSKADVAKLRSMPEVITTVENAGQFQVVIGDEVGEVYRAFGDISRFGGSSSATAAEDGPKGNLFNRFVNMISSIFSPILWTLAGTGLLKAFLATAVAFSWINPETSTYIVLNALSDTFIYVEPLARPTAAARYFKASEFTSLAIAGAMVYPSITALTGAPDLTFLGIPMIMVSYVSSVIPIIIIVWIQAWMEKYLYKWLGASVRRFLTPMIVVLVLVPLTFLAIGPASNFLASLLGDGIGWVFSVVPWLGGALLGGLWQFFVIFGIHWGFIPIMSVEFADTGQIALVAPIFAGVLGMAGAIAGVWVKTKNRKLKELGAPATLSAFLAGITEPGIYGLTLPLKRPFAFALIGGAVGGAIIAMGGVASNSFVVPGGLSLPAILTIGSPVMAILGVVAAILIAFLLTVLVGFDDPANDDEIEAEGGDLKVVSPLDGTVIPLSDVPDAAFAAGSMGNGVGIEPRTGVLFAPFDGTVMVAFPTGHAIGLRANDGTEVLLHIGVDTVQLKGEGFDVKVAKGQDVKAGDVLVEFDMKAIKAAGYSLVTPVIITNSDNHVILGEPAVGPINHGDSLFFVGATELELPAK